MNLHLQTPTAFTDSVMSLALDRDSVRVKDRDGRLRIAQANISKANICPYRGSEIPGYLDLGLEPDKIYNLLRDPDELTKAMESSNGVPLLRKHVPVNAEDHQPYDVVGSLGTDANFDGTFLTNSLFVNAGDAIEGIESGKKKQLSMGYHYTPDMTPGKFSGKGYDGVMRDIVVNHVALVEDGRAGPDVVVGDSTENLNMKPTRIAILTLGMTANAVAPLLAMDSKVVLPKDLFSKITTKNFKDRKIVLLAGVRKALDGNLRKGIALDASMEGVAKLIDALENTSAGVDEEVPEEEAAKIEELASVDPAPPVKDADADTGAVGGGMAGFDAEPLKAFLREKGMGEDDINAACGMLPKTASDEFPDKDKDADKEKDKDKDTDKPAKDADMKDMVTKPAMDEALKVHGDNVAKQVRETERGIRTALSEVKPWVGELAANLAFDSGTDVYRHALGMIGVDGAKTLHADALLPVLKAQKLPGAKPTHADKAAGMGFDASIIDKASKIAPGIARITQG